MVYQSGRPARQPRTTVKPYDDELAKRGEAADKQQPKPTRSTGLKNASANRADSGLIKKLKEELRNVKMDVNTQGKQLTDVKMDVGTLEMTMQISNQRNANSLHAVTQDVSAVKEDVDALKEEMPAVKEQVATIEERVRRLSGNLNGPLSSTLTDLVGAQHRTMQIVEGLTNATMSQRMRTDLLEMAVKENGPGSSQAQPTAPVVNVPVAFAEGRPVPTARSSNMPINGGL